MAPIPAICQQCGRLFIANNLVGGTGQARITFIDSSVGPCPHCRVGVGRIPNGTYEIADTVTRYLAGPDVSVPDLVRLYRLLREAQQRQATPEEVSREVTEQVPAAAPIATFLSTQGLTLLSILLTIIVSLLAHLDTERLSHELEQTRQEVQQVRQEEHQSAQSTSLTLDEIERMVEAALGQAQPVPSGVAAPSPAIPKLGRNELCYCGSGTKYKKCHGR